MRLEALGDEVKLLGQAVRTKVVRNEILNAKISLKPDQFYEQVEFWLFELLIAIVLVDEVFEQVCLKSPCDIVVTEQLLVNIR